MIFEENMFLFKSEQAQPNYEDDKVILSIEIEEIGNINRAEMETDHDRYKPLDTGEFDEIKQDADQIYRCSEDSISCTADELNNGIIDCTSLEVDGKCNAA